MEVLSVLHIHSVVLNWMELAIYVLGLWRGVVHGAAAEEADTPELNQLITPSAA